MLTQKSTRTQWQPLKKGDYQLTQFSGLSWYAELLERMGLLKQIADPRKRKDGWSIAHSLKAMILMQIAGCHRISDVNHMQQDPMWDLFWKKASRKEGPSESTLQRALKLLGPDQLQSLLTQSLIFAQKKVLETEATLDQDATIVPSHQSSASYTYKGMKGYQPSTVSWFEKRMVVHTEYRPGNMPASQGILAQLEAAIEQLPSSIQTINYRADGASYQKEVIQFCQKNSIRFTISASVCRAVRDEAKAIPERCWKPLKDRDDILTDQSYAELACHPEWATQYRFIAIRRPLSQQLELDINQEELASKQVMIKNVLYRITLIVTNREEPAEELIHWHHERCGFCEQLQSILKNDFAGGCTPSKHIDANAAWWMISAIAHNIKIIMDQCLNNKRRRRMKQHRLIFITLPARVVKHARGWFVKVSRAHYDIFKRLGEALAYPPPG